MESNHTKDMSITASTSKNIRRLAVFRYTMLFDAYDIVFKYGSQALEKSEKQSGSQALNKWLSSIIIFMEGSDLVGALDLVSQPFFTFG